MVPLRKMFSVFMSDGRRAALLGALIVLVVMPQTAQAARYTAQAPAGAGVRVCLIDTGVPEGTPGVVERVSVTGSLDAQDPHGAQMAAIMRTAYAGVQIVSVQKVDGRLTTVTMADTVDLCVARGTRVIAMSFTLTEGGYDRAALQAAVDRARAAGVVVVAAAGNEGRVEAPANLAGVIGVGAVDGDGQTCRFSASGQGLVMALGCDVENSPTDGTSDAAAYVAGTAAAKIATSGASGASLEQAVRTAVAPVGAPATTRAARRVRVVVKRVRGGRVQVTVTGRVAGDVLFVRAGGREIMRQGARAVLRISHRVHRITVTVTSAQGNVVKSTHRVR